MLGIVVFGDSVFVSPGMLALRTAGLAALVAGVIMVARAPALSSLRKIPAAQLGPAATRDKPATAQDAGAAARRP